MLCNTAAGILPVIFQRKLIYSGSIRRTFPRAYEPVLQFLFSSEKQFIICLGSTLQNRHPESRMSSYSEEDCLLIQIFHFPLYFQLSSGKTVRYLKFKSKRKIFSGFFRISQ